MWDGWITLEEAKENSCGKEEWWKIAGADGKTVEVKQYVANGPQDKPIYRGGNGSMYLGEWKEKGTDMHGFGIYYFNHAIRYKGLIHVGNFVDGKQHGTGKQVWLKNAPSWKKNQLDGPAIQQPANTPSGFAGRPSTCMGVFRRGFRNDSAAIVSLKDGTTRKGPWEDDAPVGDWWKGHQSVEAAAGANHDNSDGETNETATAKPAASLKASRRSDDDAVAKAPAKKARTLESAPVKVKKEPEAARGSSGKAAVAATPRRGSRKKDHPRDEEADAVASNGSSAVAEVGAVRTRESPADCIEAICEWLIDIFGYSPCQQEMMAYANTFFERGFYSSGFIRAYCKAENLDFMKPPHRLSFLENAGLENA